MILTINHLDETLDFGRRLGRLLFPGAVVALVGQLGAGKTHLARGICEGLDIPNSKVVNSPTFVLIQEYTARLPIYHFDAYRLANSTSFQALGTDEYFFGEGVCLVEWADRVAEALPREHLRIEIRILDPDRREFHLEPIGPKYEEILMDLGQR